MMYLDFHGFREKPFSFTPDPRFIFLSKNHREAFAHLLYGINNRVGFIALTGEVGTGKTTVLRALLNQLDATHYCTALIFNPSLSPAQLLQTILRELGVPMDPSQSSSALDVLNLFLLKQNAEGRTVVLVIDEAQDLEPPVLEQIRLISNLETDREKLIQIVLAGQPELVKILDGKGMRQLAQRIIVRYHLEPMDFNDTVQYINHRIEVAGGKGGTIFSKRSLKQIFRYSRGLPRLINAACDRALLAGYAKDQARITGRIASAGIKDIEWRSASPAWRRRLIWVPTLVMLVTLGAGVVYFLWPDWVERLAVSRFIEATVKQPPKESVTTGDELFRSIAAELGRIPEEESARRAFNALAGLWKVPPVPEVDRLTPSNQMERAALDRKLRLYRFSGNLGALLRIDYPAALELNMPGLPGKRFISILGMENDQFLVDPPIASRRSLSPIEIERLWSGQGFLLWRDPLNLLDNGSPILPGAKGAHVRQLQALLKEAGIFGQPLSGVYDRDTLSAVRAFQSSRGIEQDGIVGGQTLMVLYRSIDRFKVPKLLAGPK
ncbi:MAG: AAA family ATPase [Thermodesulfobacteriota bacterium]